MRWPKAQYSRPVLRTPEARQLPVELSPVSTKRIACGPNCVDHCPLSMRRRTVTPPAIAAMADGMLHELIDLGSVPFTVSQRSGFYLWNPSADRKSTRLNSSH